MSAGRARKRQKSHARRMTEPWRRMRLSEAMLLNAAIERRAAKAEGFGGLRDVAVAPAHDFADEQGLDLVDAHVLKGLRGGTGRGNGEVAWFNLFSAAEQDCTLHGVLQFAHISGPCVMHHLRSEE